MGDGGGGGRGVGEEAGGSRVDDRQDRLQHLRLRSAVAVPSTRAVAAVVAAAALEDIGPQVHQAPARQAGQQRGAQRGAASAKDGAVRRVARRAQGDCSVGYEGRCKEAGHVVAQARGGFGI